MAHSANSHSSKRISWFLQPLSQIYSSILGNGQTIKSVIKKGCPLALGNSAEVCFRTSKDGFQGPRCTLSTQSIQTIYFGNRHFSGCHSCCPYTRRFIRKQTTLCILLKDPHSS